MKLVINGHSHTLSLEQTSVHSVLTHFNLNPLQVSVELNGTWHQKNMFKSLSVKDGDVLEIVHFVGGGAPSI
ncbi:MAG: sulfur carrier protein ThiS [bacterium]